MTARHPLLLLLALAGASLAAEPARIPAGGYPLFRGTDDATEVPVRAFRLVAVPVTGDLATVEEVQKVHAGSVNQ